MTKIIVPKTPVLLRFLDRLMAPLMFLLGGCRRDAVQETHPWHAYNIDPVLINKAMALAHKGSDTSQHHNQHMFLFHAPLLGGWKKYVTYEVDRSNVPFFVGWLRYEASTGKLVEAAAHRLPIYQNRIRLLEGTPQIEGWYFAIGRDGIQIPLILVGRGALGDGKYPGVRLF